MARGKKVVQGLTLEEKLAQALVPVEEQPYQIPNNWCYCLLNGITEHLKRGKAPKYVEHSEIPVFAQKCNQKDGTISLEKAQFLNPEYGDKIDASEFLQDNDIVVNSTGTGTLGRVGLFKLSLVVPYDRVLPDSHITTIRTIKHITPEYVYYYLKYKQEYLELQGVGSTNQKELRPETLANLKIPLPPLAEQQRIVDRIESIFAKLDEAKEKAQAVVDSFELRKSAILHKAFTGELTAKWREEHGLTLDRWTKSTFSDVVDEFKYGLSEKSDYGYDGIPVFRIPNVTDNGLSFDDLKYLSHSQIDSSSLLRKDDVLIIRSNGSKELVGKSVLVPSLDKEYTYASFLIRARLNPKIVPAYFVYYINSSDARIQMFKKAKSSAGINNINSKELGAINILVCSVSEQSEIVRILDEFLDKENAAKEAAESVLDQIETMKKAVLARAFCGELGTNDPTEESAIELLKSVL